MRNELKDEKSSGDWEQIHRELDGAMDCLEVRDREAILLRFFHGQAFAEIGARVGLSEEAARKRVDRALERLRSRLVKKGVVSAAAVLGSALSAQSAQAVPLAVGQSLASTALAQAATAKLPVAAVLYFMTAKLSMQLTVGVIVACLLIVSGTGLIVHEVGTVARLSTGSTTGEDARKADAAMLHELRSRAEAGEQRLARLQGDVDQAQKTMAASTIEKQPAKNAASSAVVSRPDGSHPFLEAYPQARSILIDWGHAQLSAKYAGFYTTAQLTPAQIEAFETRTMEYGLKHLETTEKTIQPTKPELPSEEIRAILGESAYMQFEEFKRVQSAYGVASQVAYAAGFSGTPLSKQQSVQFAQLIAANAPATGNLASNDVDWDAVMKQSGTLLTPDQFKAAQPILLKRQFQQAVGRAQEKGQVASTVDKKP